MLPHLPEVPSLGFGYPFDGFAFLSPGGPLSAPNAFGFRSPKLSSEPEIEKRSPFPLSALALSCKPIPASHRRFNGLLSPVQPVPFWLPEGLVRVGASCSPELFNLSGVSLCGTPEKTSSSSFLSPLALGSLRPCDQKKLEPRVFSSPQPGSLPP